MPYSSNAAAYSFLLLLSSLFMASFLFLPEILSEKNAPLFFFSSSDVSVFFCPQDSCEEVINNLIINSTKSIMCALYDADKTIISDALVEKATNEKGVYVLLLLDEDNAQKMNYSFVRPIRQKGLMHDKFCVFDDSVIFSGSYNPTIRGSYANDNNLVVISSSVIAKAYAEEFERIRKGYSRESRRLLVEKEIPEGKEGIVQALFCPVDDCENNVVSLLLSAEKEVKFMAFSFTSRKIADTLAFLDVSGINVQGIIEKRNSKGFSAYRFLLDNGVDVSLDKNSFSMHHKAFIIDRSIVITGSYNPTENGNSKNSENIIVFHDKNVAGMFLDEFKNVKRGKPIVDVLDIVEGGSDNISIILVEACPDPPGNDEYHERVILYNKENHPVSLGGWYLLSESKRLFLNGSLSGKKRLLIDKNAGLFSLVNRNSSILLVDRKGRYQRLSWKKGDSCVRRHSG